MGILQRKLIVFILLQFIISPSAFADCWQIQDNDRKNFCLARVKQDNSYCWQIKENSIKQYCLAILQNDTSYCWQIDDNDIKHECLALIDAKNDITNP